MRINNNVRICYGDYRSKFKPVDFNVSKLVKTRFGFRTVYVDTVTCRDVGIAKVGALTKITDLKNSVPVVIDRHGSYHYYHPKFRKWYKDLDEKQLDKYFNWLSA